MRDPRAMQEWLREHNGGDSLCDEVAEINRRLASEKADSGPVNESGPIVQFLFEIDRKPSLAAVKLARALDQYFGLHGVRLTGEPDRDPYEAGGRI